MHYSTTLERRAYRAKYRKIQETIYESCSPVCKDTQIEDAVAYILDDSIPAKRHYKEKEPAGVAAPVRLKK